MVTHGGSCRAKHNTAHTLLTVITAACEISKQAYKKSKKKTKGGV